MDSRLGYGYADKARFGFMAPMESIPKKFHPKFVEKDNDKLWFPSNVTSGSDYSNFEVAYGPKPVHKREYKFDPKPTPMISPFD